jgi:hypothetical protein
MGWWINFAFHRRGISITFPLGLGRRDRSRWCRNQPGRVKCLSLSSILCPFLRRPALRGGEALLHVPLATFAVYAGAFNTAHATLPIYKINRGDRGRAACGSRRRFNQFWPRQLLSLSSILCPFLRRPPCGEGGGTPSAACDCNCFADACNTAPAIVFVCLSTACLSCWCYQSWVTWDSIGLHG